MVRTARRATGSSEPAPVGNGIWPKEFCIRWIGVLQPQMA